MLVAILASATAILGPQGAAMADPADGQSAPSFTGPSDFTTYYVQPSQAPPAPALPLPSLPMAQVLGSLTGTQPKLQLDSSEPTPTGLPSGADLTRQYRATHPRALDAGNMIYHGGAVEHTNGSFAIFWKPSGFPMDPSYQPTLTGYLSDVGGSSLMGLATQYTDTSGAIQNVSHLGGSWVDTASYPSFTLLDNDIRNEVINAINTNNWDFTNPDNNYFVYTASGEAECFDATGTQCFGTVYCGYHSAFQVHDGAGHVFKLRYQYVGYIGDIPEGGCGPATGPYPHGSFASDDAAKVTSHEQMETMTDPDPPTGWFDATGVGGEIGDKCNTNFGTQNPADGSNVTLNGHPYLVQEEWSNAASACALSLQAPPPTFNLSVTLAGSGLGAVTSVPAGINCGATCSAPFAQGTTVTLTAVPNPGSTFTGWSGACSGVAACVVTMNAATAVTATFTPVPQVACSPRPPVSVVAVKGPNGTLSVTVTASGAGNALKSIQFGSPTAAINSNVDIGNQLSLGSNFTYTVPGNSTLVMFTVRRMAPGVTTTLPMMVTDGCGTWQTLVGGGPAAF